MIFKQIQRSWGVGLLFLLTACAGQQESPYNLELIVASEMRSCVGVVPQQCLLVKESPAEEWHYFYDTIAGFDFEPGFEYILKILRHDRGENGEKLPQDLSRYHYQLVKVEEKRAKHSAELPRVISRSHKAI